MSAQGSAPAGLGPPGPAGADVPGGQSPSDTHETSVPGDVVTLGALIDQALAADVAPDDVAIATRILTGLGVRPDARAVLVGLVAEQVWHARRARTRALERQAFRHGEHGEVFEGESSMAARKRLLAETFALPDGRRVAWGQATVEDHAARIEWLRKFVATVEETIDQHVQAMAQIEAAGVSCLDELEAAA